MYLKLINVKANDKGKFELFHCVIKHFLLSCVLPSCFTVPIFCVMLKANNVQVLNRNQSFLYVVQNLKPVLPSIGGSLQRWSRRNSVRQMVSICLWFGNAREVAVKVSFKSVKQLLGCLVWSILSSVTLALFRSLRTGGLSFYTILAVFLTSSPKRASRTADWMPQFRMWLYSFILRRSWLRFPARNSTNLTELYFFFCVPWSSMTLAPLISPSVKPEICSFGTEIIRLL
jgi:hypothetical protein